MKKTALTLFALSLLSITAPAQSEKLNTLTPEETAAGWKLLFNGKDLNHWHNFKSDSIRPGWQVQDGLHAGWVDIETDSVVGHLPKV